MPKLTRQEHITIFLTVHKDLYDYSDLPEQIKSDTKLPIRCKKHDYIFKQTYHTHKRGVGCPICGREKSEAAKFDSEEVFMQKLIDKNIYGYDLSKVVKTEKVNDPIIVGCPVHGDFKTSANNLRTGKKCKKCDVDSRRKTKEQFANDGNKKHNFKFDYSKVVYVNNITPVIIGCPVHGYFEQLPNHHLTQVHGCPKCSGYVSKSENEIADFVKQYTDIKQNDQKQHNNKCELDIYIPLLNKALEFDGLYWHSSKYKNSNYHKWKQDLCNKKNISLIQIFEDEWNKKQNIVKSNILSFINRQPRVIQGKECVVMQILDNTTAKSFFDENHIKGYLGGGINMMLFCEEELVAILSLNSFDYNKYEILQYCTKINTNVVNGFETILENFEKYKYQPKEIIYNVDNRWPINVNLEKLGFIAVKENKPDYYFTDGTNRWKNENDNKYKRKEINKIYDSGSIRFVK